MKRVIILCSLLLVPVTMLPVVGQLLGGIYATAALLLGGALVTLALELNRRRDRLSALRLYLFSLAYLALLFAAMVVDARL